jgi:hypothetical protein
LLVVAVAVAAKLRVASELLVVAVLVVIEPLQILYRLGQATQSQ